MSWRSAPIGLWLAAGTVFAALGQVLFKIGATGRQSLQAFANGWIALGLLAYGLGAVMWIYALSRAPLSQVYPFTALTFVLVYACGVWWFGEPTSPKAMLGVALVLLGLYLITTP
jgi:undecaprenyl phosphate-alpha-L-ara4N flippase subunit ArnE